MVKLIECPRDAMQGIEDYIDISIKAAYINQLLEVGFDTVDFGSFVSPKSIPQMRDTAGVLDLLDLFQSKSKLLAIVANVRGAEEALTFEQIDYLGFPLSISEIFQKRNTNQSIEEAMQLVEDLQNRCEVKGRSLIIYLSMAFGNPYGEFFSSDTLSDFVERLDKIGVLTISFSDTIGAADPFSIEEIFKTHVEQYPQIEFGAHLHSHPSTVREKIEAALKGGCLRFDSAIGGFGGCPMAMDKMVGNVATELLIETLQKKGFDLKLNQVALEEARRLAGVIF